MRDHPQSSPSLGSNEIPPLGKLPGFATVMGNFKMILFKTEYDSLGSWTASSLNLCAMMEFKYTSIRSLIQIQIRPFHPGSWGSSQEPHSVSHAHNFCNVLTFSSMYLRNLIGTRSRPLTRPDALSKVTRYRQVWSLGRPWSSHGCGPMPS